MALIAGVFILLLPGVAAAQCILLPGERTDRLAAIAAGHVDADVAFIGRVVERHDAVKRHGLVWHGIVFRVVATFAGASSRQRTVFVGGGCADDGGCVLNSEEQEFRGHRLQLVFANHRHRVGLVSASACTDAGPLTAAEVRLMLHPPTLPMTGAPLLPLLLAGVGCLLVGAALARGADSR
jgi:hypothetical protein